MKVLILVSRFHPNLTEWVPAFRDTGWSIEILVGRESVNRVERVTPRIIPPDTIDRCRARTLAEEIRPDLVIIRSKDKGHHYIVHEARRRGARAIYYDQRPYLRARGFTGWRRDIKKALHQLQQRYPLKGFTTTRGKGEIPRMFRHWVRVPMPLAEDADAREYFIGGVPTVLLVGRLANQKKRHFWVIEALEAAGLPYRLLVAGAGDDSHTAPGKRSRKHYQSLKAILTDPYNQNRMALYEDIPHEEMPGLFNSADIFVLPSSKEMLGISVVEAMAHGCAVITSTGVGAAGYITHGEDGLIFERDNREAFQRQLRELLADQERVRSLGRKAAATIRHQHAPTSFVHRIRDIAGV